MSRDLPVPTVNTQMGYCEIDAIIIEPSTMREYPFNFRLDVADFVNMYDLLNSPNVGLWWDKMVNPWYRVRQAWRTRLRSSVPLSIKSMQIRYVFPLVAINTTPETFIISSDATDTFVDALLTLQSQSRPEIIRNIRIENFMGGQSITNSSTGQINLTSEYVLYNEIGYCYQTYDGVWLNDFKAIAGYYIS